MMQFDEKDIAEAKVGLSVAAGFVRLWEELKGTEEVEIIRSGIPMLAGEFKPLLQSLSTFTVQMDIDAIKQMEAAGIERHYAVALRMRKSLPQALSEALGNATRAAKAKKKNTN